MKRFVLLLILCSVTAKADDRSCHIAPVITSLRRSQHSEDEGLRIRGRMATHPLRERMGCLAPSLEIRRLYDFEDFLQEYGRNPDTAGSGYGHRAVEDWHEASAWAHSFRGNPLSSDFLLALHGHAARRLAFHGFEGRRIVARWRAGEIDRPEMTRLLARAYQEDAEIAGVPHPQLVGRYRSEAVDEIAHGGSSRDALGQRYFTREELQIIRSNPLMRLDEGTLHETSPGHWTGRAYFSAVGDVRDATARALVTAQQTLSAARTPAAVVRAVIILQRDLIMIHPFLDGNGRTIRLMADELYMRNGLPPPALPWSSELTESVETGVEHTLRGMQRYLDSADREARSRP